MNDDHRGDEFDGCPDDRRMLEPIITSHTYRIPTVARLRVCARIEPERDVPHGLKSEQSLAERYKVLTTRLPLFGGQSMRSGGSAALDALAERAPWAGPLVGTLDREVRTQLALGRPWVRLEPTLLVGPPGIGKSWLTTRMAQALGLKVASLQLGNTSDDRTLSGTARGWTNSQPAWPLVVIASTRTANPLLVVDEIDKAGGSDRAGRPHNALLAMVDPDSARRYYDQCLLAECDLSQVSWIACANSTARIPPPLLSRFRVVELERPSPEHFDVALASAYAEIAVGWDVPISSLPDLPGRAVRLLKVRFVRDRSLRVLARDARALLGAMLADGRKDRTQ